MSESKGCMSDIDGRMSLAMIPAAARGREAGVSELIEVGASPMRVISVVVLILGDLPRCNYRNCS